MLDFDKGQPDSAELCFEASGEKRVLSGFDKMYFRVLHVQPSKTLKCFNHTSSKRVIVMCYNSMVERRF